MPVIEKKKSEISPRLAYCQAGADFLFGRHRSEKLTNEVKLKYVHMSYVKCLDFLRVECYIN